MAAQKTSQSLQTARAKANKLVLAIAATSEHQQFPATALQKTSRRALTTQLRHSALTTQKNARCKAHARGMQAERGVKDECKKS